MFNFLIMLIVFFFSEPLAANFFGGENATPFVRLLWNDPNVTISYPIG
ncbi:MAG: hypothetical protein ACXQT1_04890 [Methermicoccaceae archaeon]